MDRGDIVRTLPQQPHMAHSQAGLRRVGIATIQVPLGGLDWIAKLSEKVDGWVGYFLPAHRNSVCPSVTTMPASNRPNINSPSGGRRVEPKLKKIPRSDSTVTTVVGSEVMVSMTSD